MKNILIPTDFSNNSWNATKYAINFFNNTPCNFYLLHVSLISYTTSMEVPLLPDTDIIEKTILKEAKITLEKILKKAKQLSKNPEHHFSAISTYDFFIEAVKEQIEEKKIDTIVMGTKGVSGLIETIIGSNTADLITRIKCPVLIVPENAKYRKPKEIVFPTDYNIFYQTKILNSISELTRMFNSYLRILYVSKKNEELSAFQKENKYLLKTYLAEQKCSFHKITNTKVEAGLQCFIESRDIDMIVMIAKNLNLFQRILFKPTVEEITYHTDIPFFVLHE